jgi:hypothetical protein
MQTDLSFCLVGDFLRVTVSKMGFRSGFSVAPEGLSVGFFGDFDFSDFDASCEKVSHLLDTFEGDVELSSSDCGGRFENNVYRARRTVRDLLLCNEFEHFATFTLDEGKRDRFDVAEFKRSFSAWLKAYNRYHGCRVEYVLVPEQHADGAWHMHGVLRGLPDGALTPFVKGKHPRKLVEGGFSNWSAYAEKFGFCSFGAIRDRERVATYISAYVTKALTGDALEGRAHLFMASKGLNRPVVRQLRGVRCFSDPVALGFYENDFCFIKTYRVEDVAKVSEICPEFDFSAVFGKASDAV